LVAPRCFAPIVDARAAPAGVSVPDAAQHTPNPAQRNPNGLSFLESGLFNDLSHEIAGFRRTVSDFVQTFNNWRRSNGLARQPSCPPEPILPDPDDPGDFIRAILNSASNCRFFCSTRRDGGAHLGRRTGNGAFGGIAGAGRRRSWRLQCANGGHSASAAARFQPQWLRRGRFQGRVWCGETR